MTNLTDAQKLTQYEMLETILHPDKYDDPEYKACKDVFDKVKWLMIELAGVKAVLNTYKEAGAI